MGISGSGVGADEVESLMRLFEIHEVNGRWEIGVHPEWHLEMQLATGRVEALKEKPPWMVFGTAHDRRGAEFICRSICFALLQLMKQYERGRAPLRQVQTFLDSLPPPSETAKALGAELAEPVLDGLKKRGL